MNTVYFAKHILLETGVILVNGAVVVCGGVIVDVGPRGAVRRERDERVVNLGDMLLLPGLINMHTHLEEAPVRGIKKDAGETFAAWSAKKYSRMRQLTPEQIKSGIKLGAREMISHGITTVVDSTRTGFSAEALAGEPIRAVIIREVAGEEFCGEGIEQVRQWLQERVEGASHDKKDNGTTDGAGTSHNKKDNGTTDGAGTSHNKKDNGTTDGIGISHNKKGFAFGVGPYAAYSMTPREHRRLIEYSYDSGCLWACHIAESAEEVQAFCEHSGDFYFNQTRARPWPAGTSRLGPVHYALAKNIIPSFGILFHCNYVNSYELALLAAKRTFAVVCSRYGADMEHKSFPVEAAINRGLQICLGTEGTMPAGEASLFDELFHLKMAYPQISAAEMLRWVTKNPAAALRAPDKLGSVTPGKFADIIGVKFAYDANEDLLETMLVSDVEVAFVMVGGEEVIVGC